MDSTKTKCTIKNIDYFENIDSPSKAYSLGLMMSDGYVTRNNSVNIGQSVEHAAIINFMQDELGFEGYYNLNTRRFSDGRIQYYPSLSFTCKKMCKDLVKYNVIPAKTLKMRIPEVRYMSYVLLGLFDGDGCIHYGGKNTVFQIAGTKQSMLDVCEHFKKFNIDLSYRRHSKDGNCYIVYCYKKSEIKKIYDLFYQCELGFKSKKEIFEKIIHDYDLDESSETRFEYNIDNRHVYNSYIIGVILGNGNFLSESRFKINRGNVDNLAFKEKLLESYITPSCKNIIENKVYSATYRSKKLRYIYNEMNGKLSQEIINRINEYSLGILYLDKGKINDGKITITNLKYSKHDNERICSHIKKKYNVVVEYKNETYWIDESNSDKFLKLIREVIISYSNYKTDSTSLK